LPSAVPETYKRPCPGSFLFRERAAVAVDRFRKSIGFGLVVQLARPKSRTFTTPCGVTITFEASDRDGQSRGVRGGKRVRNLRRIFHRRADAQALRPIK